MSSYAWPGRQTLRVSVAIPMVCCCMGWILPCGVGARGEELGSGPDHRYRKSKILQGCRKDYNA